jgi:hypothetical protein
MANLRFINASDDHVKSDGLILFGTLVSAVFGVAPLEMVIPMKTQRPYQQSLARASPTFQSLASLPKIGESRRLAGRNCRYRCSNQVITEVIGVIAANVY